MQKNLEVYDELTTKNKLIQSFQSIRQTTEALCSPLITEDYVIQGMPDVSPPKWHLAHTSWFFETFILSNLANYKVFNASYYDLFNSYYLGINNPYPRPNRGLLSRPSVEEIYSYRDYVNAFILEFLNQAKQSDLKKAYNLIRLGLEHEQQHQELLLMDIKYNFSLNPALPTYLPAKHNQQLSNLSQPIHFTKIKGGIVTIGYQGLSFCYDNELPEHQKIISDFSIADRLVTNGEYLEFILAKGYENPLLWLSDGWDFIKNNSISKPLYWFSIKNLWYEFSLSGLKPLNLAEPVSHVSYFEAEAYARWRGCRLPTEEEWEYAVIYKQLPITGNLLEEGIYHPLPACQQKNEVTLKQFFGDLWEWTTSPYSAYPRYKPLAGFVGEYNGKFMNSQYVLRGGCCITPQTHIRATYRNFYQPEKRWQFSGIRLAKDD